MALASLLDALSKCTGGETIDATGWDIEYGRPKIPAFSSPVTIKGGTFHGLYVSWRNVIFDGCDIALPSDATFFGMRFQGGSNIHFRNCSFHGPAEIPVSALEGRAVFFDKVDDWSVTDCEITHTRYAITWRWGRNWEVSRNHIHHCRTDAIRGEAGDGVKILDNRIHDLAPETGDHPDAVQVWAAKVAGAFPSRNIEVARNICWRGEATSGIQGIFFREYAGLPPHENINIHDNIVLGGRYNGILVTGSGEVRNNICVGFADQRSWFSAQNWTGPIEGNTGSFFIKEASTGDIGKGIPLPGNTKVSEGMSADEVMALYFPKPPEPVPEPEPEPEPEPTPEPPPEPDVIEVTLKAGQTLIVRGAA